MTQVNTNFDVQNKCYEEFMNRGTSKEVSPFIHGDDNISWKTILVVVVAAIAVTIFAVIYKTNNWQIKPMFDKLVNAMTYIAPTVGGIAALIAVEKVFKEKFPSDQINSRVAEDFVYLEEVGDEHGDRVVVVRNEDGRSRESSVNSNTRPYLVSLDGPISVDLANRNH